MVRFADIAAAIRATRARGSNKLRAGCARRSIPNAPTWRASKSPDPRIASRSRKPRTSITARRRSAKSWDRCGPPIGCGSRRESRRSWRGARVDLHWDSRSEALLWLDGRSQRSLNIGREDAVLVRAAQGGETLTFHLEIACNRAFGAAERGASRRRALRNRRLRIAPFRCEAWSLFHDFETLRQLEADRDPPHTPRSVGGVAPKIVRPALDTTWAGKLLHELNAVCNALDPEDATTWDAARTKLATLLAIRNGGVVHHLSAIGHAHIDTAWLWPIEETLRKCQRSFANAIALMDEYPSFKFACSQACQYAMIEEADPDLFARIREKVANGQWIPIGGSWVEPDCNLPSGKSMTRQFLYGQRYFERQFGRRARIFWNPDVFGYAGQLPQLMREAGMDRFLTQKLSWNRFTTPPHHSFRWQGIDGSEVLTHFPPADTYNGTATIEELRYHAANYKDADRSADALYLFGHGDGGGGANAGMIETLDAVPRSSGRAAMRQSAIPTTFFDRLAANAQTSRPSAANFISNIIAAPTRARRRSNASTAASKAALQDASNISRRRRRSPGWTDAVRATAVEALWRVLLVNQFHDILPGSSIGEVVCAHERELAETPPRGDGLAPELLERLSDESGGGRRRSTRIGFARAEIGREPNGELRLHRSRAVLGRSHGGRPRQSVRATAREDGDVRLENGDSRRGRHGRWRGRLPDPLEAGAKRWRTKPIGSYCSTTGRRNMKRGISIRSPLRPAARPPGDAAR